MSLPLIPLNLLGQGGTLAFPTLRATANYIDTVFADDHDVTLPAGTTTGDLVIMFGYFASLTGLDTVDIIVPSGWTLLALLNSGTAAEIAVYACVTSGPMSSVNLAKSGSGDAFNARTNSYSFSAHSHNGLFLPAISSIANQTTANPDPPALALPGTYGGAPHVTWLSCVFKFGTNTTISVSSGYADGISTGDGANRMMSARRNLIATTEDPGAWATTASSVAFAFTIGVRGPE